MNISKVEEQVMRLDSCYFPFPWSKENWQEHFAQDSRKLTTLYFEDELVGFCCWEFLKLEDLCHIHKVLILPRFRGKKLGRELLQKSKVDMRSFFPEAKRCFLEVEETNEIARNLYVKAGFELLEVVQHFYGPKRNGIRMMLNF